MLLALASREVVVATQLVSKARLEESELLVDVSKDALDDAGRRRDEAEAYLKEAKKMYFPNDGVYPEVLPLPIPSYLGSSSIDISAHLSKRKQH